MKVNRGTMTLCDICMVVLNGTNRPDPAVEKCTRCTAKGETSEERANRLRAAFRRVAPTGMNWKEPIDAIVTIKTDDEYDEIDEAVIYFTGSVATITPLKRVNQFRVRARGYYAAIGS